MSKIPSGLLNPHVSPKDFIKKSEGLLHTGSRLGEEIPKPPPANIITHTEHLQQVVHILGSRLCELRAKLEPLGVNEPTPIAQERVNAPKPDVRSGVSHRLRSISGDVDELIAFVNTIIDQVDLPEV